MPFSFSGRERTVPRQPSWAALPPLVLQAAKGPSSCFPAGGSGDDRNKDKLLRCGTSSSRGNETESFLEKMFI